MKLPDSIEKEIQALESEMDRLYRDYHLQMAGNIRFRDLRAAIEANIKGRNDVICELLNPKPGEKVEGL